MYNLTAITAGNATSLLTITQGVNTVLMKGMLGILILVGLWLVMFISMILSTNDPVKSSLVSGFIIFTLSVSLAALDLVPQLAIFIPLIITGIIAAVSWGKG